MPTIQIELSCTHTEVREDEHDSYQPGCRVFCAKCGILAVAVFRREVKDDGGGSPEQE